MDLTGMLNDQMRDSTGAMDEQKRCFLFSSKHWQSDPIEEAMSRRLSDATTEHSSNDDSSVDERPKPHKKIESTSVKAKTPAPKNILHDPKWTDDNIQFDVLPDKLSKIGKEAFERRDLAATAAASALQ